MSQSKELIGLEKIGCFPIDANKYLINSLNTHQKIPIINK